jgi:hypothetical protein
MAYNFESTFTKPLLVKLDTGMLSNAKDWAESITSAYVSTIRMGMPIGVPPVLPAPGLNPTAPPPFSIGVTPFNTVDLRRRRMYKVLYAYFLAKEKKLDKGSIQSLSTTIALLIRKVKEQLKRVKLLVEEIRLVKEELKNVTKLINQIIQDIKKEIKQQIADIKDAFKILDSVKLSLPPADFEALYSQEYTFLQKIADFNPSSISSITELALLLSDYGNRTDPFLSNFGSGMLVKRYLYSKLVGAAKMILQLAEGVFDPSKIINVVNDLAKKKERVQNLAKRINQFDLFVRYVRPKLKRLEIKKNQLVRQIKEKLRGKIKKLKDQLAAKIKDSAIGKKYSKKTDRYDKSTKSRNDKRKKHQQKLKQIRTKIKTLRKIYKLSVDIVGKSTTLYLSATNTFELIKQDILQYQKQLIKSQKDWTALQKSDVITNINVPQVNLPQPTTSLDITETNNVKNEASKVTKYLANSGLPNFAEAAARVVIQTKCDFQTFVRFFEKTTNYVQQFVYEIIALLTEIEELSVEIKKLKSEDVVVPQSTKPQISRLKSLKDALKYFSTQIIPKVQYYPKWAKVQVKTEKSKLEKTINKFKQELKISIINSLPIKSSVQDPKDKAEEAKGKVRTIRNKIRAVRKLLKKVSYIAKMAKGGINVYKNIEKGDYTLQTNQVPIDTMVDGYYDFRSIDKPQGVQAQLAQEKLKVKDNLKGMVIIDFLVRALIDTFKSSNSQQIISQLNSDLDSLKSNPPAFQTLKAIRDLFLSPPTTQKELVNTLNTLTLAALQDTSVVMKLVNIEMKYLAKIRETIKTLLDIKNFEKTRYGQHLKTILKELSKNNSYIMFFIRYAKAEVKKLVSLIKSKILKFVKKQKEENKKRTQAKEAQAKRDLLTNTQKKKNSDAYFMTFVFATAARVFWAGTSWVGPTGSQHRVLAIGSFRPRIRARSDEGASTLIRQLSLGYQTQLIGMKGLVIPPAITGIPPLPFNGYK